VARKMIKGKGKRKGKGKKKTQRKNQCRFCRKGAAPPDYKNIRMLQKLCTAQGKLFSRKRSGNCAKHQRMFKRAAKRARFLALLPYIGR
jgi:small subunit ribosomal protein S18